MVACLSQGDTAFETLFAYPRVLRRHREGPLTEERAAYLSDLAAQCVAPATLIKQARCCLRVAIDLERWPADHCSDNDETRDGRPDYVAIFAGASHPSKKFGRLRNIVKFAT